MPELTPTNEEIPAAVKNVSFTTRNTDTARIMFQAAVVGGDVVQIVKNGIVQREINIPVGKSGRMVLNGACVVG